MKRERSFERYLHLTGIPAFVTPADGSVYLDPLWARDLSRHTYFGSQVRVLCPVVEVDEAPPGTVRFEQAGVEFAFLPHATSIVRYLLSGGWFRALWRQWRHLRWPNVVFMGFVEHPIPYGWTAAPMAWVRRVPWYTFIESSPWRVPPGVASKWKHRLRAAVAERVNRFAFRRASFAFISQPAYAGFLRPDCPRLVSPASWFLHEERATPQQIGDAREAAAHRRPHLMFLGRLDPGKGIETLLEMVELLDRPGFEVQLTVLGSGQLRGRVEQVAATLRHVELLLGTPVPYGPAFFAMLRGADVLVVPNLGDEQPRNVFDAYSQGVPVLASDTTGLRSIVQDGVTGRLVPAGDAHALAAAIRELLQPDQRLRWAGFGDAGYDIASHYDHDDMHRQRATFVEGLQADRFSG